MNAFHLDGIQKFDGESPRPVHSPTQESSHNTSTVTISSLDASEHKPLSSKIPNDEKLHVKINDQTKLHDKPWAAVPQKSSNLLKTASHPKRQTINHPAWHKIQKEPRKFSTIDNSGLHGIDVVVVDIPSTYSRMRWEKPRLNSLPPPSLRYAPYSHSPSLFDLLFGLDSISQNIPSEPAGMEKEVYFKQSLDSPSWNRQLSFGRLSDYPTIIQQKAMIGNGISKDVSATNLLGKSTERGRNCTCICEERKP